MAAISADSPNKWTGMMALVRLVIADSTCFAIQVVSFAVNIHEYRLGLQPGDAAGGGDEGKRRGDDLIARIYSQRHQGEQERVRSRSAGDGKVAANQASDLGFQFPHLRTHDELLALHDLLDGSLDFFLHGGVFGLQIEKRKEQLRRRWLPAGFVDLVSDCLGVTSSSCEPEALEILNYIGCQSFPRIL